MPFLAILALFIAPLKCIPVEHPCLVFDRDGISRMIEGRGTAPLFDSSLAALIAQADNALQVSTEVPLPEGGISSPVSILYKKHHNGLYNCGVAYQFTSDRKYADWARKVLLAYAEIYPSLGYHTHGGTAEPGRLFWQALEDHEWTVNAAIAYDCIYNTLSRKDRQTIESRLFRPMCEFYMYGTEDNTKNNYVFNRMHNHGTWALAAVGLAAMAMGEDDYLQKVLLGTDLTGQHGGFIQQVTTLFSPDGYYMEGAYYQRYALYPYMLLAQSLERLKPELDIFHLHGSALLKSGMVMLDLSYGSSLFKMNDSGESTINTREQVYAYDVIYAHDPSQKMLLGAIRDSHPGVAVNECGFRVAKDIAAGLAETPVLSSRCITDGPEGERGATMVLRNQPSGSTVTMKACTQGSYHGHFDKLTLGYYDNGREILRDYGFARFVALGIKNNGHYTDQNRGYAMTTVAHNTLVVDEHSDYDGITPEGIKYWPSVLAFDAFDPDFQYMAARDTASYPGVVFERWTATAVLPFLEHPLIIDILKADSQEEHQYDYPLHYDGYLIRTDVPYEKSGMQMHALSTANGYQHLWVEAVGRGVDGTSTCTWLSGNRLYSFSAATTPSTVVDFLRIGASDPDFNLRPEPALMLRERASHHCFATCLETHGLYLPEYEHTENQYPSVDSVSVLEDTPVCTSVRYGFLDGHSLTVTIASGRMSFVVK